MKRRDFGKSILTAAVTAAAANAATPPWPSERGATTKRPWPPGVKISVQISRDTTDEELQFVQQLGCTYVNVPGDAKNGTAEHYIEVKNKVESFGLRVWNIGNASVHNMEEVTLNLPGRDKKVEEYKQFLRNLGKAGLRYTTYAHMGNGIWSSP